MNWAPKGIRVHAISPGLSKTRAASILKDFDLLLNQAQQRAPFGELVDIVDIGMVCAYLANPCSRHSTGETVYVDGGLHVRRDIMKLWIGNLAPGTTAQKVEQLLQMYSLPQPDRARAFLEGPLPAMLVEYQTYDMENLRKLISRIEGLYWEGSPLIVTPLQF